MKLELINGPNLDRLGSRQVEIYGSQGLQELQDQLTARVPAVRWSFFHSNHEGELIERLHSVDDRVDGVIINPGGLSHTSVVLLDALLVLKTPVVEVHISQVLAREDFRRTLLSARGARAVVCGMGLWGYEAAAHYLLQLREGPCA